MLCKIVKACSKKRNVLLFTRYKRPKRREL